MTDLRNQRRLAASVLKCGVHRVWIDPDATEDAAAAVTRSDVRRLVSGGVVKAHQKKGVSRGRTRHRAAQKAKGRRIGPGSRKGAKYARKPRKERWIQLIRPIRRELRELRGDKKITPSQYREYYMRAKGGQFRSRNHMLAHMRTERVVEGGEQ
jgi:large subunit ribosomal protein L19e